MKSKPPVHDNNEFVADLKKCATQLAKKLQNEEYTQAAELIQSLIKARDQHIFNSIGKLTRALHDSIASLQLSENKGSQADSANGTENGQVSGHLRGVIDMMHNAADKTLDTVEACAPIATNLGQEAVKLQHEWSRLKNRDIKPDEFRELYTRMKDFLDQAGAGTEQINAHLQDVMLEQSYQDLTGQVLIKIIGLVTDIETELINLMRAAHAEGTAGSAVADSGKNTKSKTRQPKNSVSSQDDVDNLLSSLGF